MNSRKHQKVVVTGGPFLGLVALVVVALGLGIVNIYFTNEQNRIGNQIRKVEKEIMELTDKNHDLKNQIASLETRQVLEQKMHAGLIRLQPIAEHSVRRVGGIGGQTVASLGPTLLLQAAR